MPLFCSAQPVFGGHSAHAHLSAGGKLRSSPHMEVFAPATPLLAVPRPRAAAHRLRLVAKDLIAPKAIEMLQMTRANGGQNAEMEIESLITMLGRTLNTSHLDMCYHRFFFLDSHMHIVPTRDTRGL